MEYDRLLEEAKVVGTVSGRRSTELLEKLVQAVRELRNKMLRSQGHKFIPQKLHRHDCEICGYEDKEHTIEGSGK
jgi:hypothetical protein